MKKKWILSLLALCMSFATLGFVACGETGDNEDGGDINTEQGDETTGGGEEHVCMFNEMVTTDEFLETAASCQGPAHYHYSCTCGKMSDDVFVYGEKLEHVYDQEVVKAEYADVAVTCEEEGSYFKTCACGAIGEETFIVAPTGHTGASCTKCGEQAYSEGLLFTLSQDETYYTVSQGTCTDYSVRIPSIYEGLPVKEIAYRGFYNYTDLTGVTIPKSVTLIGEQAFTGCSSLRGITVDERNTAYKSVDNTLYSKDGKTLIQYANGRENSSFTIPDGVEVISAWAFGANYLSVVTIPSSVTEIQSCAFSNMSMREVYFVDTKGWWYASDAEATEGTYFSTFTDLSNADDAAYMLTMSFKNKFWHKDVEE